ncbi:MAG: hypothetical protein Q7U01_09810, partial [Pseudomonas sp.]|nr:hypothetical protein [Pseudomonas sp.]
LESILGFCNASHACGKRFAAGGSHWPLARLNKPRKGFCCFIKLIFFKCLRNIFAMAWALLC